MDNRFNGEDGFDLTEDDTRKASSLDDEFAELDYRPKPKAKILLPLAVIALALILIIFGINYMLNDSNGEAVDEVPISQPEDTEEGEETPEAELEEPGEEETDLEEETEDEELFETTTPPNYDLLEPDLHNWLIERTGDGEVIMLHTDELDDVDRFFERFNLAEDNVIVYKVDSRDGQFVNVLFGMPYSQWSLKVVFIWSDNGWVFLREEDVQ